MVARMWSERVETLATMYEGHAYRVRQLVGTFVSSGCIILSTRCLQRLELARGEADGGRWCKPLPPRLRGVLDLLSM